MPDTGGFTFVDATDAEIDQLEALYSPLAQRARALVDTTIRTRADPATIQAACTALDQILHSLQGDQLDTAAGVHYNATGRAWFWGNAVVGLRNAIAPPLHIEPVRDGTIRAHADLGAAYEGPPGLVHGGIAALLLDHVMGALGSSEGRFTMTRTLNLTYHGPLPLGPVEVTARVLEQEGRKVRIAGRVEGAQGLATDADGLFIIPQGFTSIDQRA